MNSYFSKNISQKAVAFILLVLILVSSNLNWGSDRWKTIAKSDAKGYYAYLPAIFIYNDLNFGFFDEIEKEKYYNEHLYYDYRGYEGAIINKYYAGTALCQLPFFLTAHGLSHAFGYEIDGYSKLYAISINIAALFYLFIGLIFLNKILKQFVEKDSVRAFTLIATVFGTHLFYYTVVEGGMSHVFSFAFFSMFIYFCLQYFKHFKAKYIVILALILGVIILIRPLNIMIVLSLPLLAGNYQALKKGAKTLTTYWKHTLLGVFLATLIVSIQFIIYKISTGSFIVYSYGEEGFNFLEPHFFDILFSYKKGLFLYTPLLFISLFGSYSLYKKSKFQFWSWIGFFIIVTYILSSWWNWWYGGSFSSRVYIEFIPFFMILFAMVLEGVKKAWLRSIFYTLSIILIVICQIQTFQYRYNDIHWEEMTKEKYWDVFLRIDKLL